MMARTEPTGTGSDEDGVGLPVAATVSHGDQESDGAVRADAHRYEQLRGVAFDEPGQTPVQLVDLCGELLDALDQQAQGDAGGLGHGVLVVPAVFAVERAEARAGAEQLAVSQLKPRQPASSQRAAMPQCGHEKPPSLRVVAFM
ncbi:hypothetical protein [Streptomyces sp. NPDC018610]|uniref:hypothetical protein n=1 Tax=Streptomyces sp. NPDC018610 TaxID=3365049 RepID=UPI00379C0915